MATKTIQEQLDAVEAAIVKAEKAQSWEQGGRSETHADLAVLYRRRDELEARLARVDRGGIRGRRAVPHD